MTKLASGQVAVVTGGATGIGLALVEAFARRGLHVAIADIDADGLQVAVERLASGGAQVMGVPADVADRDSVRSLREQVLARFGAVDVLCNNAGVYHVLGPVWKLD